MRVPPVPLNPAGRGDDRLCPGRWRPVPEALTPRRRYGRLPGRGHLTPVIAGMLSWGPPAYRDRSRREKRPPERTWLTAAGRLRRPPMASAVAATVGSAVAVAVAAVAGRG